ncbi:MAG: sigma-70 family RNA polymerase sigma factor [Actinomycetota bacterium]
MGYEHTAPLLTADDEVALARRIETGLQAAARLTAEAGEPGDQVLEAQGRAAKNRFIEANIRLVLSIAGKTRVPAHVDRQDVIQDGMIGLEVAVERFDWRRGYKFSTYATWWIRRLIQQGLENTASTVRVPSHKVSELRSAQALDPDAELPPTLQTAARFRTMDSLDRELVDAVTVGDLVASGEAEPDAQVTALVEHAAAHLLVAQLDPATREMVVARFGLDGSEPQTYTAIADARGVSAEAIRRRILRALDALRPGAVRLTDAEHDELVAAA